MLQSVVFRIFLLIYAIYIVHHSSGYLPIWGYYTMGLVYFITYYFLKRYDKSILRLFVDFIFINFIVWGKEVREPITFLFILLPIVNAINYSGKKSNNIILMFLITTTFIINMKPLEKWIVIPLLSLWFIYILSWLKRREWDVINNITQHIDTYFVYQEQIERPHSIYKKIIIDLNRFFLFKNEKGIQRISAYTIKNGMIWLINSSSFMWKRTMTLNEGQLNKLKEKKCIKIDNIDICNYLFYIRQGDLEYIFTCEVGQDLHKSLQLYRFSYIMLITFSKVALLLNSEYRISEMRNKKFNEIKDNVLYVNKAVKIMHFIRNRMTPLTNLIAYYKNSDKYSPSVKTKMEGRMKKEVKQADSDLKEILSTANYLLDKSNNPFIEPEMKEIRISKIFIVLSEIVERLLNGIVEIDDTMIKTMDTNLVVSTSLIESKIMLTDWINNMFKYKDKYYSVSMSLNNDLLIITFLNDYNIDEDTIQRLIRDVNSQEKDAVLEGKDYGYGIYIIKSIANSLNIGIEAYKDYSIDHGSLLGLKIKMKSYEQEESISI